MLNSQDFVKKLEIILQYYQLNASAFADKIGVQRSSLSHLLSGRNKPSLEFVVKITETFPEVDLYWFLMNKGNFPNTNQEGFEVVKSKETPKNTTEDFMEKKIEIEKSQINKEGEIEKIIVFYQNGTFKSFTPS